MKLKYLGAMALGVLFIAGCSQEEKDRVIQTFTGINPAWFRSTPAAPTLNNAQELQANVLNLQTSNSKTIKASSRAKPTKMSFVLDTLILRDTLQSINNDLLQTTHADLACKVSGSKNIEIEKDTNKAYSSWMKVSFNSCEEEGLMLNGRLEVITKEEGLTRSTFINFLSELEMQRNLVRKTIQKGSQIEFANLENNLNVFKLTQTCVIEADAKIFGSQNLVYRFEKNEDGLSYYPVSGREYILNGSSYFDVDPSYDASLTPFILHANTLEVGGLFKYVGEDSRKLEIEISNVNEITLRVDTNGDGIFEFNEETKVNIL